MAKDLLKQNIFKNTDYYNYLVQYQGKVKEEVESYTEFLITIINDKYAILSIPKKDLKLLDDGLNFSTIVYIKPAEMFTLQQISPSIASQANFLQLKELPLNLTGKGVLVAVIDTGIDYLCDEFMDDASLSRIDLIWDQTIDSKDEDSNISVPFGTIYKNEQIQKAINEFRKGNDPYSIVPSKDDFGHGTKMAGLIGASGKNPDLKGIVPECRFISIKLIEDYSYIASFGASVPVFNISVLFAALEFLYQYSLKNNHSPLVIYLPIGSNLGNHRGNGILDQFIDFISMNTEIVVVTGAGNQRITNCHASGNISENDGIKVIDIDIPPEERHLWMEIWVDCPNILSVDIISPSGENSGVMNSLINKTGYYSFIFEKTSIKVNYFIPEENSGDELIRIRFYNLQPGIWKLRLSGNLILDGTFNIWIPQEGLTSPGTHFSPSDTYGTITNPGNSDFTITAAAYNQNNNNITNYSGMAFGNNFINAIDVAAGGINALTVAPDNKTAIVNGTSVAAAITAGACAMLFQWGIVEKNDPNMYSKTLKTYLARGVITRSGDIYPNAQWGYGILSILNMFKNIN